MTCNAEYLRVRCQQCGKWVEQARLKILYTRLCAACAHRLEPPKKSSKQLEWNSIDTSNVHVPRDLRPTKEFFSGKESTPKTLINKVYDENP